MQSPAAYEAVMAYEHPDLLERFETKHRLTPHACASLFDDVKRWLWLNDVWLYERLTGRSDVPDHLSIVPTQEPIDEMWHEFILFTRDYAQFCERFFGRFLHHTPTTEREKRAYRERSLADGGAEYRAMMSAQIRFVLRHLGREVAERWYAPRAEREKEEAR